DLAHLDLTIPQYLERLERSLIDYLAELGVESEPGEPGFTGVWRNGEKLAAIGIKLNRTVVSHGFALNLTTDLGYFDGIVPCGHAERRPTSVAVVTGQRIDTSAAADAYARHFERLLGTRLDWLTAVLDRTAEIKPAPGEPKVLVNRRRLFVDTNSVRVRHLASKEAARRGREAARQLRLQEQQSSAA